MADLPGRVGAKGQSLGVGAGVTAVRTWAPASSASIAARASCDATRDSCTLSSMRP